MAEREEDLDLDAKPAPNKKRIIIIAVAAVLLIAVSVGVTLMLLGGEKGEEEAAATKEVAVTETHYLALEKMIVNFAQKGPVRFLQVEMQVMAHDPEVLKAIEEHMPVIRNDILVLLGSQQSEQLSSREGKEMLRGEILAATQRIVKTNAGLDGPQAVYFTNFVMQ